VTTFNTPASQATQVSGSVPAPVIPATRAPVPTPGPPVLTPPPAPKIPLIGWIAALGSAFAGFGGWAFPLVLLLGVACGAATALGWFVWRWRTAR